MKSTIAFVLVIVVFCGVGWGAELPSAPAAQPTQVEHDPGAWAFTTGATATGIGAFVKPKYGLMVGVAVGVLGNLQNSKNAHENMAGGIVGAVVGYCIIKTLRKDWHKKN
jgi:MFS family permease